MSKRDISLSPTSVDKQIDSLLIAFQDDASEVNDDAVVPEGISSMLTALLLLEADEDEEESDTDEDVTSDAELRTSEPGESMIPKLNIDDFASDVATLIGTAIKRLDVETVIFNRAKNFIADEYGQSVAEQFVDILVNTHDIDINSSDDDDVDSDHFADGAAGPAL